MWIKIGAVAFAVIFFVVGVTRIVELSGLGLTKFRQRLLSALHIVGCALFSSALSLVALDPERAHRTLAFALFIAAMATLAPGQVTIAIYKRRATDNPDNKDKKDKKPEQ